LPAARSGDRLLALIEPLMAHRQAQQGEPTPSRQAPAIVGCRTRSALAHALPALGEATVAGRAS